jgi:tocopherol O-methyltransferase
MGDMEHLESKPGRFISYMPYNNSDIVEYYNTCENSYKDVWHLDECMAMHLGIWDEGVKTLKQSLLKENELLATLGKIKSSDLVLDAGCGVGGSSIWLAKHIGCNVKGITLVDSQVKQSTVNAQNNQVQNLTSFDKQDYTKTTFPNASFDVVWAINSACYAKPKSTFINEAYRLLKPGGRLVVSDAFQGKDTLTEAEHQLLYDKTYHGWVVNSLDTPAQFLKQMETAGFKNSEYSDQSLKTMPSVKRLFWYYFPATLYNQFSFLTGKKFTEIQLKNTRMLFHLYRSMKKGLWQYGMMVGEKI